MKTATITVFAKWVVKAEKLEEVLSLLTTVAAKSREEDGNVFYTIHQQRDAANTLWLHEGYLSAEAIETHRATDHFQQLVIGQIVPLLEHREVVLTSPIDTAA